MAGVSTRNFASQIKFVVEARGDNIKSIEPVLCGIFAQTAKEIDVGGHVALSIFEKLPTCVHFLKEHQMLADLLIRAWLLTDDEQYELVYAREIRIAKHSNSSARTIAERFRELLNEHHKEIEKRLIQGSDSLRSVFFRKKLERYVAGAEVGCQSETLKLAAHAHIRASSPASVAALYKASDSH